MNPLPAYFDLDSDKARREAFGRELDRIDEQHRRADRRTVAKAARKQALKTGGLLAEAGYTNAPVAPATETKTKRETKSVRAPDNIPVLNKKLQRTLPSGFSLKSVPHMVRKIVFTQSIRGIDVKGLRMETSKDHESRKKK